MLKDCKCMQDTKGEKFGSGHIDLCSCSLFMEFAAVLRKISHFHNNK